jgi:hypothetical protein
MTTEWDILNNTVNSATDGLFGEKVRLLPYKSSGGGFSESVSDSSRDVINAVGQVIGRGTFMKGGPELTQKRASADWLLSINEDKIAGIKQHDHVILMERSITQQYEITYIEDSSNKRPKLHLLKIRSAG